MRRFILQLAVGIILLNVLSSENGIPLEFRSTALIMYPPAALDYFQNMMTKKPDCECLSEFKTLPIDVRVIVCYKFLVDAIPYALSGYLVNFVNDNFRTSVQRTYESFPNLFIERLTFGPVGSGHKTAGQWCIKNVGPEQWAVSPGLHQGVVFVYKKPTDIAISSPDIHQFADFELFGLSEEIPYFHYKINQQQLERRYVTGGYDVEDSNLSLDFVEDSDEPDSSEYLDVSDPENVDRGAPRSLCHLNEYEQLRVCAVTHLALNRRTVTEHQFEENHHDRHPNIVQHERTCISGVVVLNFKPSENTVTSPLSVDVLPCVVSNGTENNRPELMLLTNDPYTADSVFVVEPVPMQDVNNSSLLEKNTTPFMLKHFMSDVRALKPFTVRF